ncbi:MAG: CHAT domain-containing tetratricopeptide repeat protein [Salinibacter sp.]|uniref:CHAT domain-containing protein n=1 Tax=Salinibacter sp. TaxID=2065818 RepID=UPI002FC37F5E
MLCLRPAQGQVLDSATLHARADSLAAAGDSLREEQDFAAAQAAYRQARATYREAGIPKRAAAMTGNIGVVCYREETLQEARQTFLQAAQQAQTAGAREQAANNLNNAGLVEWQLGTYDVALEYIREAVAIHRDLGNRNRVASGRNNIANIQEEQGEFENALENLRWALRVNRALNDSVDIAMNLNNIGLVLRSQGQYGEASKAHRKALRIHRQRGDSSSVADALNNLGIVRKDQGRYDEALRRYRESLRINRTLGNRSEIATNLNNVGEAQLEQGHTADARDAVRKALRINRQIGNRASVATNLYTIGEIHRRTESFEQAETFYRKALRVNRELGRQESLAKTLYGMGQVHLAESRFATADSVLTRAVRITDELLKTATGADRRDYLAREAHTFQALVTARIRAGAPEGALRAFERGRARLLAERLSGQDRPDQDQMPTTRQLRAAVDPGRAAVLYANTDTERPLTALVVTPDAIRAHEIPDTRQVQSVVAQYQEALGRLQLRAELVPSAPSSLSLLQEAKGLVGGEAEKDGLAKLVRLYTHDLSVASASQVLSDGRHRRLGQYLNELLISPLEQDLMGTEELIVVPDGALGYLPFETLVNWAGEYLVEKRSVRYVQSLRVLRRLQQRPDAPPTRSKGLLALGGAVYDTPSRATDTGGVSESQITESKIEERRQRAEGPWPRLPGSLQEVEQIGQIASPSRLLTGPRAREDTLQRLNARGTLRRYRAIHFAAHGLMEPDDPSRSALVLSGAVSPRPDTIGLDGYLTMEEIAALRLDADFVGLSACQTGLGRIYRGTGVVSLAQAFLRAGADATAVSLWPVYDASTKVFMEALYRRVWRVGQPWTRALTETKRAFLDGDHGERLRAPRFWAPFVHYGRETP